MHTVKTTCTPTSEVSYDVSILSEVPPPSAPLVADYLELIYALPSVRATLCSFEAARDGHLTILGIEQTQPTCSVRAARPGLKRPHDVLTRIGRLPTARGRTIADWITSQRPESLSIYGLGDGSQIDLRICNLVTQTGDSVEIFDTYRNDAYLFTVSDTFNVTANGVDSTSTTPTPSLPLHRPGPTRSNWSTPTATTRSPSRPPRWPLAE